jgi:hypothetical protein
MGLKPRLDTLPPSHHGDRRRDDNEERPMILREPLNPVVQNALILLASGVAASVFCASVYGATLPVEEPGNAKTIAVSAPAPSKHDDAAGAATLRAMLAGQQPLFGVSQPLSAPQR